MGEEAVLADLRERGLRGIELLLGLLTACMSRGSVSRPACSTISNSIVAAVEKVEILGPLARRGRNDAAVQEVAHDAVGRRRVGAVAGYVVAADRRGAERGEAALYAEGASAVPRSVARSVHHLLREVEHDVALTSADGIEQGEGQA